MRDCGCGIHFCSAGDVLVSMASRDGCVLVFAGSSGSSRNVVALKNEILSEGGESEAEPD
jgi:hypothetical protein